MSIFEKFKIGFKKSAENISSGFREILIKKEIDDNSLDKIEEFLISSDVGIDSASEIRNILAQEKIDPNLDIIKEINKILKNYIISSMTTFEKKEFFNKNENLNVVLIAGVNGSGKTTTIGMMLGLLKPTSGEILIDNKKIEENRIEILKKINFISPYIELPKKLTVKQNLIVYGKLYNIKNLNNSIDYLVEKLRLQELLNKITGELSSGQKNRVSLAKALINSPKVLLLDEPTASLDPEVGDYIRTFLENYKKERNISILLASHNMNEVKRLCKFVLMMKDGVIIDKGSPSELIEKHGQKNLEEVFLKLSRSKK